MNVFFEVADNTLSDNIKYLAIYNVPPSEIHLIYQRYVKLISVSLRVWLEKDDTVFFIKNRLAEKSAAIFDSKEFCWIKLKCAELSWN